MWVGCSCVMVNTVESSWQEQSPWPSGQRGQKAYLFKGCPVREDKQFYTFHYWSLNWNKYWNWNEYAIPCFGVILILQSWTVHTHVEVNLLWETPGVSEVHGRWLREACDSRTGGGGNGRRYSPFKSRPDKIVVLALLSANILRQCAVGLQIIVGGPLPIWMKATQLPP